MPMAVAAQIVKRKKKHDHDAKTFYSPSRLAPRDHSDNVSSSVLHDNTLIPDALQKPGQDSVTDTKIVKSKLYYARNTHLCNALDIKRT